MLEKLFAAFGVVLITGALLFVAPILSVLAGAFAGWIVGWLFSGTAATVLENIGGSNLAMWQIGAILGFVGSFFRASSSSK